MRWSENNPLFFQQVRIGHKFQQKVADMLEAHGLPVEMKPLVIVGEVADEHGYHDKGDIREHEQAEDMTVGGRVIEVKSRDKFFTSRHDYPYRDVFVESVEGYDVKVVKPFAYVIISQHTEKVFAFAGETPQPWGKRMVPDSVRKIDQLTYTCPRNQWCDFSHLVEVLRYAVAHADQAGESDQSKRDQEADV